MKNKKAMFTALANFIRASADEEPEPEKKPCEKCGKEDCDGSCDEQPAGESSSGGDASAAGEGSSQPDAKALAAENATLKAQLEAAKARAAEEEKTRAAAVETERTARVNAEVTTFLAKVGPKLGKDARESLEHMFRGAKLGVVSLRQPKAGAAGDAPESERFEITQSASLSAEASAVLSGWLEQFAAALHPAAHDARLSAGGPSIDAAARAAAGADDADHSAHFEALRKLNAAGVKQSDADWAAKYQQALAEAKGVGSNG
jgi:hypothetical protein